MSLKVFNKKNVIIFLLLFFVFSKTAFAGDLKFNTNGGNFGIGTTTPSETLEIQNANTSGVTQTRLRITDIDTNDNPELQLQYTANKHWAIYVDKANNNALTVWNTNSMFTILASGNIGIATLTPEYKLDVNGIIRGNTLMATASVTTSLLFYQTDLTIQSGAGNIFLSPSSDKDVEVTQGILKAPVIKQNNIQVLDTLSSGNSAITVSGSNNSRTVTFKTCSSNETLVYNGTDWACIASGFIAKAGAGDGGAGIPSGGTIIFDARYGISYGRNSNTITFSPIYGSTANTIAQGNTSLKVNTTGNLSGGGTGTSGGGIDITLNTVNNPTFSTSVTTPYIYGSTSSYGSLTLESTTHSNKGNILINPNGGNVGINTSNPLFNLDVNGVTKSTSVVATIAVGTPLIVNTSNISLTPGTSSYGVVVTQGYFNAPVIKQNNIQVLDTLSSGNSAINISGSNNSRTITFKTCSSGETLVYSDNNWACIASGFIAKAGAGDGGAGIPFGGTLILNSINGISYGRSSNTITFGLTNTGVIAGIYPKVTVDIYGRVTYGYSTINLTTDVSNILPIVNGGTNNNTFTSGQVTYYDGSKLTGNNNLYWDKTNNRLGINTSSPANALDVTGNISASGYISGTTINGSVSVLAPLIQQNGIQVIDTLNAGGGISISGSNNSRTVSLSNSGVTVGTYPKVNVDTYGRVTYGYGSINLTTDVSNILPITYGGTNNNTFSDGQVVYYNGTKLIGNNNLYWDYTNSKLGIGTSSPNQQLEITGNFRLPNTTSTGTYGVIYKGGSPFIHDFNYGNNGTVTTSGANTFIGINAGNFTMGSTATEAYHASFNTGIGNGALHANTTGFYNTALGHVSLYSNTTGYWNTAIGFYSLFYNTIGNYNTALGLSALHSNTTGSYNTALGMYSGRFIADGTTGNTASSSSTYLGYNTKALADGDTNETVIGYNATGAGSNSVVLGNDSVTKTILKGSVGIGTTSPSAKLDVIGGGIRTDSSVTTPLVFSNSGNLSLTPLTSSYGVVVTQGYLSAPTIYQNDIQVLDTLSSGNSAITVSGSNNSRTVTFKTCNSNETLVYNGTDWVCSASGFIAKAGAGDGGVGIPSGGTIIFDSRYGISYGRSGNTITFSPLYGSTANTIAQGNTSINVNTTGNLVGGGTGTAGGGLNLTLNTVNNPTFSTSVTTPVTYGSTSVSGTLTLQGTSNSTPGNVFINPNGGNVGIGNTSPANKLDVTGNISASGYISGTTINGSVSVLAPLIQQNGIQVIDTLNAGGGISISGSNNSRTVSLSNSGVTAGTYPKVNVDTYGRVTYGYSTINLTTDISNILPIANGGTNNNTYTGNKFLWYTGTSIASSGYGPESFLSAASGTTNYVAKFTGTNSIGNSTIYDNGTNVGIGTNTPSQQLEITGNFRLPNTTSTGTYGVIYKGGSPFIHDFNYGNNGTVTTEGGNTFIGINAGNFTMGSTATQTVNSSYNTGVGYNALYSNTTGYTNTAIGYNALYSNTTGYYNTAIGVAALYSNTTGIYNTAIGTHSGRYIADGATGNTISSNSTYLGFNTKALADGDTNETVIGYNATGVGSNSVVLGNDSVNKTILKGSVGIGNTSPANKLDVTGNISVSGYISGTTINGSVSVLAPLIQQNGIQVLDTLNAGGGISISGSANSRTVSLSNSGVTPGTYAQVSVDTYGRVVYGYGTIDLGTSGTISGILPIANGGTNNNTFSNGQVVYYNGTKLIGNNNLYWDYTNSKLGIGTSSPSSKLDVVGGGIRTDTSVITPIVVNANTTGTKDLTLQSATGNVILSPATGYGVGIGTTSPNQQLEITGNFRLPNTTSAGTYGVIYKGGSPFIHDFNYGNNGTVTTSGANTFIGINAGNFTMGSTATEAYHASFNTGIGNGALHANTTGFYNTALGHVSLYSNTTGYWNTAIGFYSLFYNTIGNYNTALGLSALHSNTTGSYNTALGMYSGRFIADGTTGNTASSSSTYLGYNTKALADGDTNETVIGYNATGAGSNSVVLGNDSVTKTILKGSVGIGTTSPSAKLDVIGGGIRTDSSVTTPLVFSNSGNLSLTPLTSSYGVVVTQGYLSAPTIYQNDIQVLDTLSSGNSAITVSGSNNSRTVTFKTCNSNETLVYNGTDWVCSASGFIAKAGAGDGGVGIPSGGTIIFDSRYGISYGRSGNTITFSPLYGSTANTIAQGNTSINVNTTGNLVGGGTGTAGGGLNLTLNTVNNPTFSTSVTTPVTYGSTSVSGTLTLQGTSNSTPGNVFINPNGGNVGIGNTSPANKLDVTGNISASGYISGTTINGSVSVLAPLIQQNGIQVIDTLNAGGGISISGSNNSRTVSLSNSGVTAGTYPKVNVDTYGRVTYGYSTINLTTDISNILPIANGGTNNNTYTGNKFLWYTGTSIASSGYGPESFLSAASGTTNYVAKFTGTNSIGNSTIYDNGTNVGIGTNTPSQQLEITGNFRLPNTTSTGTYGVIYKGGSPFIHDFNYGNNGTVTTEGGNTFIGINAGNFTMGSTATQTVNSSYNTGVGYNALYSNTTGYTNTAIGYNALYSNTTGYYNTAIGFYSLYSNTTGYYNTAIGLNSLSSNTTGNYNTVLGVGSGYLNTTGSYNTGLGYDSLSNNTTGIYNIAIGPYSGRYIADGSTANQTSSSSIYLGYNTKALANGDVNETVIGYDATGNGNNTVTIGNSNVLNNYFFGNVIADSFTGPSGQTMTITMSQDGTDCVSSSDGSQVLVSTSCAQKPDKSQGWIQTNRFQYYESYSGYNLDCNSDGDKADWCDSGINATAEVGDPNTSWNQAQTSSLTLTASTVKGAVKYTWTMYADWNGNGSFDGYSIVANGGTCPSDHDGGCFLEEMWPRNQWTEDFNGDTDGFIGSGDQTWMGIDLNNTYNGGSDPDPSDRIVHFNMPTVAKSDCSTCGRVVVSVKARDSKGTVLASSSLTIDPKGINDLSKYSWTIGNWSSIQYGDKMVNALGATYTAFSWHNRGFKYSTSTDNKSSSYGVSYYDAQAFCNQNNARLMTIAELKQVYSLGQSWPTSYVWSLSLDPTAPRTRLLLYSDGRVDHYYLASFRYSGFGGLCVE